MDAGAGTNVEDDDEDAVEDDEDAAVEDEDDAEEDANPRTRSTRALTIWRIWNGWSVMTQLCMPSMKACVASRWWNKDA